jgi:hypothetical protein
MPLPRVEVRKQRWFASRKVVAIVRIVPTMMGESFEVEERELIEGKGEGKGE